MKCYEGMFGGNLELKAGDRVYQPRTDGTIGKISVVESDSGQGATHFRMKGLAGPQPKYLYALVPKDEK